MAETREEPPRLGSSLTGLAPFPGLALFAGLARLAGVALLGFVASCQTSGSQAEASPELRSEGARLSRAIDQLREADNAQKRGFLDLLAAEPCQELCALKQVCEDAYREHVAALDAIREVRAYGTAIPSEPGVEEAALVAAKLEEAEQRLEASRRMSGDCVDAEGAMKLRLRL